MEVSKKDNEKINVRVAKYNGDNKNGYQMLLRSAVEKGVDITKWDDKCIKEKCYECKCYICEKKWLNTCDSPFAGKVFNGKPACYGTIDYQHRGCGATQQMCPNFKMADRKIDTQNKKFVMFIYNEKADTFKRLTEEDWENKLKLSIKEWLECKTDNKVFKSYKGVYFGQARAKGYIVVYGFGLTAKALNEKNDNIRNFVKERNVYEYSLKIYG